MNAGLAFAPSSACGHGCLPRPGATPSVGWPLRVLRMLALIVVLIGGIGVALATPLLTPSGRARAKQAWFRLLLRAGGVRLVVRGQGGAPSAPGTLFAANHVSWLDIPAVLAVQPMRVVAKDDVRGWPIIGLLAERGGTLFIDRRRLSRLPGTVASIAGALRGGQDVLVFPEGSTRCGQTQGPFYPATLQAAIDAKATVRPVALRYRLADGAPTTAAAFVGDDTLIASVVRVVSARGLRVEVDLGPAVTTDGTVRRHLAWTTAATIAASGSVAPQAHLV